MNSKLFPVKGLLLIGPTGSGKTPLGDYIAREGMAGKRYFHFDFGHELRSIAAADTAPAGFNRTDISFIRDVLSRGALLENEHFYLAEKIVSHFLDRNGFCEDDAVILNGLPRHVDQAQDISRLVSVEALIVLSCSAEDVCIRIHQNTGNDRTGRVDDDLEMIRKKLAIYTERTTPLIKYYAQRSLPIFKISVDVSMTPADIYNAYNLSSSKSFS